MLTLTRVPKEANNQQMLAAALQAANVSISGFRANGDKALVELAIQPNTFDVTLQKHDPCHQKAKAALLSKAGLTAGEIGPRPLVADMSFASKMLYQLYLSNKHKLVFPNPNFRPGTSATPNLSIGGLTMDRLVTWQLGTSGVHVLPYWRAPVSTICDFGSCAHRFAVALSLLGTEDDMKVRALGVTVLPVGPFSKVLQIVFTPPAQPISLLCNEDKTAFYSIQVGTSMIAFEPSVFTLEDMRFINQVRRTVSHAIAGTLESVTSCSSSSGKASSFAKARGGGRGAAKAAGGAGAQEMLAGLMALLTRCDLTEEELEEQV
jgi:hypothetical protein